MTSDATAPLRVVLVDDEPLARLRLRSLVEANPAPAATVVGEAADAPQALALLTRTPCDLVLLDIRMPGPSGLQLADALRSLSLPADQALPPLVVFVTAHGSHALRAFELDAADYITKPVRRERLQAALWRVAQRRAVPVAGDTTATGSAAAPAASAGAVLVVHDRGRVLRVPQAEVVYLKAEQKYVTLCTEAGR